MRCNFKRRFATSIIFSVPTSSQYLIEFRSQSAFLLLIPAKIWQSLKQGVECLRFRSIGARACHRNGLVNRKCVLVQTEFLPLHICFCGFPCQLLEFQKGLLRGQLPVFVSFSQFLCPFANGE